MKICRKELSKSPVLMILVIQTQILKNKKKKRLFQPFPIFQNDIDEEVGLCLLPWITIKSWWNCMEEIPAVTEVPSIAWLCHGQCV